jgi:hypothetical protein
MKRFDSIPAALPALNHLQRLALCAACVVVTGCVPGDGSCAPADPAGFWWGVWHGWIAPAALIWGFSDPAIRIYETCNTGWWYDFGFYMAIISGFGGLSLIRRSKD